MAGFYNNPSKNTNINRQEQEGWYLYRGNNESNEAQVTSSSYYYNNSNNKDGNNFELYQPTNTRSGDMAEYNRMIMMSNNSGGGGGGGSSSGGTINCQDCGNQAKKDCVHMRCRTCCKSRGFDCTTHINSTWVPASVRRNRHQNQQIVGQVEQEEHHGQLGHVKRRRESSSNNNNPSSSSLISTQMPIVTNSITATVTATTSAGGGGFSGMELGNFPAELSSPALFRCVRVSSIDNTEDEVAYQTAVNIGGHVFKGILYDQGLDHQHGRGSNIGGGGESSSAGSQPLSLTAGTVTSTSGMVASTPLALGYLDPSLYPGPFSPYMPSGTPFFPNQRP